jgi:carbonic anhydrase
LAVLFEDEKYNNTFFEKWNPTKQFQAHNLTEEFDVSINMKDLIGNAIGQDYTYYTFHGSLTVPPCSEIINWFVLDEPLPIGYKQQAAFN